METNAVVANWFVLVPGAAVGAVGVPVNDGDAIVALNAISEIFVVILEVFDVILAVFDVTLIFKEAISSVFVVMLEVFEAIKFVLFVILVVFAAIEFVLAVILDVFAEIALVLDVIFALLVAISLIFEVILDVFDAIDVGKVAIVDELTPPTLFTVGKSAVPPKSFVNLSLPLLIASASGV